MPSRRASRRIRAFLALGLILAGAATLPAAAAAEPTVTIAPVGGRLVHSYPLDLRIAEAQPRFAISGTEGTALRCNLDSASSGGSPVFTPCGAPDPSCAASVCAIYTPPPLAGGPHFLAVELEGHDEEGNATTATGNLMFDVDTTPPETDLGVEGHERPTAAGPPAPWGADFTIWDDDPLAPDSAQCSFTKAGASPAWETCASGLRSGGGAEFHGPKVPNRHQDWLLQVRGVDDFGRADPSPAAYEFDPVPCVLRKVSPVSIQRLIAKGLSVTVSCSLAGPYEAVQAFFLGKAGGHILSPEQAIAKIERPAVAEKRITHLTHTFTRHLTVPLAPVFKSSFRGQRDDVLYVTVGEPSDFQPYDSGVEIHVRG